nr:hypothetical protein [Planctomycetota bacterium]
MVSADLTHKEETRFIRKYWLESLLLVAAALFLLSAIGGRGLCMVFQENIQRYVQPFDHKGPIYLYFSAVPLQALPWLPIFIGAVVTSASGWKKPDTNTRWLAHFRGTAASMLPSQPMWAATIYAWEPHP